MSVSRSCGNHRGFDGCPLRTACIEPHLDEHGNRPNPEQGIQLGVDALVEAEEHFEERDKKGHNALALP